jgi:hypothetical protein
MRVSFESRYLVGGSGGEWEGENNREEGEEGEERGKKEGEEEE